MKKLYNMATFAAFLLAVSFTSVYASDTGVVSEAKFVRGNSIVTYVDAVITNKTNHIIKSQLVKINLIQSGIVISSTSAVGKNVLPGQSWKMHAPFSATEMVDSFSVAEVSSSNR